MGGSVFLVSLETGMVATTPAFVGEASWLATVSGLAKMAISITGSDILAARALGDSCARLQVVDDRVAGTMDDPSDARLDALRAAAESLIQSESDDRLDRRHRNLSHVKLPNIVRSAARLSRGVVWAPQPAQINNC